RGLAFLDLGDTAKAIEDLSAAAETPQVGVKARAALEEARRRASGRKTPAEEDPEALLARLGELLPRAAAGDAAAEKEATTLARGSGALRGAPRGVPRLRAGARGRLLPLPRPRRRARQRPVAHAGLRAGPRRVPLRLSQARGRRRGALSPRRAAPCPRRLQAGG